MLALYNSCRMLAHQMQKINDFEMIW